ncbi:MAG TPA: OsmC family protein [Ktedonobacteraceae bacterium]
MTDEMSVQAHSIGEGTFKIDTQSGYSILLSSAADEQGPRPMEMLLVALAGCAGVGISSILRKMRQDVTAYEIRVHGERAEKDPKVFTTITVQHIFTGRNLQPEQIRRAIDLDTTNYCGVNIMLSSSAKIEHTFQLLVVEAS